MVYMSNFSLQIVPVTNHFSLITKETSIHIKRTTRLRNIILRSLQCSIIPNIRVNKKQIYTFKANLDQDEKF